MLKVERLTKAIPAADPTRDEIEQAIAAADKAIEDMSDAELKALIKQKTGRAPTGTPGHDWLLNTARELTAA